MSSFTADAQRVLRLRADGASEPWLATLAGWIDAFISRPDARIRRPGAICPFVPPALERDLIYVVARDSPQDAADAARILRLEAARLRALQPREGDPDASLKALLVCFPALGPGDAERVLPLAVADVKAELVARGTTCGEFYATNDDRSVRNGEFRIADAPVSFVAIRPVAPHDDLFLSGHAVLGPVLRRWRDRVDATDRYFCVGPTLVLTACDTAEDDELALALRDDAHRVVALASAAFGGDELRLRLEPAGTLDAARRAEGYRLYARVCARRAAGKANRLAIDDADGDRAFLAPLLEDGFAADAAGRLTRGCEPFLRRDKAGDMEGVYRDPFTIPWNFVPREFDVLTHVLSDTAATPQADVLDIGCGFGKNATLLERRDLRVCGIDVSPSAIERARRLVRHPERFAAGSVTALPWPDESFDVALDIGCFHCLDAASRSAAVAETARVLRPGGALYLRAFKRKDRDWLDAQPFATDAFGLSEDDVRSCYGARFDVEIWRATEQMLYVKAIRR